MVTSLTSAMCGFRRSAAHSWDNQGGGEQLSERELPAGRRPKQGTPASHKPARSIVIVLETAVILLCLHSDSASWPRHVHVLRPPPPWILLGLIRFLPPCPYSPTVRLVLPSDLQKLLTSSRVPFLPSLDNFAQCTDMSFSSPS